MSWRTRGLCLGQGWLRACRRSWCHLHNQSLPVHIQMWQSSHQAWQAIWVSQYRTPPKNRDTLPMFVFHKGVRQYPFAFDMFSHLFHRHRRVHQSWWRNLWALSPFCVAIVDLSLQKDHHFRHPAVDVAKTNQRKDYLLSTGPFTAELVLYSLLHPLLLRQCWTDWPNQVLEHSSIQTSATRNMHWQLVPRPSYFVQEGEWLYLGPRCPELLKGSW